MKKKLSFFNRLMMAVTFAESNEGDTALTMLDPGTLLDPSTEAAIAPSRRVASDSAGAREPVRR